MKPLLNKEDFMSLRKRIQNNDRAIFEYGAKFVEIGGLMQSYAELMQEPDPDFVYILESYTEKIMELLVILGEWADASSECMKIKDELWKILEEDYLEKV